MGIRRRRCPGCKKSRSVTTGKHRLEERRWHDHPTLGRICHKCQTGLGSDALLKELLDRPFNCVDRFCPDCGHGPGVCRCSEE